VIGAQPVLHLLAGPNGAGKSTIYCHMLAPVLVALPFVNADVIAGSRWPGDELAHAYEASQPAADERHALLDAGRSFATETVFSHPSKLDLVQNARRRGYHVTLHVVVVPVELSVARVAARVRGGGHDVPEGKVRECWQRLWPIVRAAIDEANEAVLYDNSGRSATPIAEFTHGRRTWRSPHGEPDWWPAPLTA
jgi:predicted ABC-type ATPase